MRSKKLTRRRFLSGTAMVAAAAGAGGVGAAAGAQESVNEWSNWSGSVSCTPHRMARPTNVDEVVAAVREAGREGRVVRVAGSGHSFVPLSASQDTLMILSRLRGVESIDREAREATVLGGSKLYHLGRPLRQAGLSMENLPDIDRQALAGAIATGTHGTGPALGSLSTQVVGIRLVDGNGEVVHCSQDERPDLLRAARVSLGALGVITHVRLRLLPAYNLIERTWIEPFEECLARLDERIAATRHFEFFWASGRDACAMKSLDPTEAADVAELEADDGGELRLGPADEIFPSQRNTLFNEIEYAVAAEDGPDCLAELRQLMLGRHKDVTWPLEYRTVAADDIDLSPAYGRATVTISAHQPVERDYEPFFSDVEAIFRNHDGRPHWGKIHHLEARDLERLYPRWDHFQRARQELDPEGRFLSPYLRKLLLF